MKKVVVAVGVLLLAGAESPAQAPKSKIDLAKLPAAAAGMMDFVKDIKPIFEKSCHRCHSGVVSGNFSGRRGGFGLKDRAMALEGGNSGVAIVPGKSAESRLIWAVAGID